MKRALTTLAIVVPLLLAAHAYAGSVSLTLNRVSLTNVDDAAGRWQHEGGTVFKGGIQIGNYALTRRVTFGFRRKTSLCKAPMIFLVEGSSAELARPPAAIPGFGTPFLQELPDPLLRSRLVGWAQLS